MQHGPRPTIRFARGPMLRWMSCLSWPQPIRIRATWCCGGHSRSIHLGIGPECSLLPALPLSASQTHYLLVAWLKGGLDPDELAGDIQVWLNANAHWNDKTSFVVVAWLDRMGEAGRDLVERPIRAWLAELAALPEASFVYTAWLDAGGDSGLVEAGIQAWLAVDSNQVMPEARFVYRAWLDATQDRGRGRGRHPGLAGGGYDLADGAVRLHGAAGRGGTAGWSRPSSRLGCRWTATRSCRALSTEHGWTRRGIAGWSRPASGLGWRWPATRSRRRRHLSTGLVGRDEGSWMW